LSAAEAFNAPIVRFIDGKEVEFPRLYMDFYGTLETTVRTNRTGVVNAACDAAQLTGKDRAEMLKEEGKRQITAWDVADYLGTKPGFERTLDKSLESAGMEKADRKAVLDKIDGPMGILLARLILKFTSEQVSDEAKETEAQGPPEERNWKVERELIFKYFPDVNPGRLTWDDYHLALAHARAREAALTK
jgi:hypothetical protein